MIQMRDGAPSAEDDAPSCPESEASQSYVTIRNGDALDELRKIPDASIDAIVTDPPYGLEFMGKDWDSFKPGGKRPTFGEADGSPHRRNTGTPSWAASGNPRCRNCGGTKYDRTRPTGCACDAPNFPNEAANHMRAFQAWCEQWAREALRVLKPGGHLVAFGGTRTYHRMVCAVEDAGFEIRDSLTWLYGSGFPKSLDVGKAIDKRGGTDGSWFGEWLAESRTAAGLSRDEVSAHFPSKTGGTTGKVWNWEHGHGVCTQAEFARLCDLFGLPQRTVFEAEGEFLAARRGTHGRFGPGDTRANAPRLPITAPATDAARQWQGWGTALKPAVEPIVLARKPLNGTVAVNVLAHGTGALNIDGTRVAQASTKTGGGWAAHKVDSTEGWDRPYVNGATGTQPSGQGRWPANVLLSHAPDCGDVCTPGCPAAELDAQSGITPSNGRPKRAANQRTRDGGNGETHGAMAGVPGGSHDDTGGASRFFPVFRYQAKAPAKERPKVDGVAHPTVKPLELMRWLVRLVTPPGGTVLDPFAGSGTTLQAAREEGFTSIGIEREPTYLPLIAVRLGIEIEQPAPEPVVEVLDVQVTADDIEHDKALADLQGVDYVPWPGEPVVEVDPILKAIGDAPDRAALVALWRAHGDTWTPAYDEAARDRLTAIKTGGAVA